MHRFILPEFNTHRMFSRNSASSRAIPIEKQLDKLRNDGPMYPVQFGTKKAGMQSGPPLQGGKLSAARMEWTISSLNAILNVKTLNELNVHKEVANRLLEPFLPHTVIVTSVSAGFDNFFNLRCSEMAQPEIRAVADAMKNAIGSSQPCYTVPGEWHTPYIQEDELELPIRLKKKISAARCARVSYLTHDGQRDYNKDVELYDRLVRDGHLSPLEHVATPLEHYLSPLGNFVEYKYVYGYGLYKPYGWAQLRHNNQNMLT